MYVYTYRYIFIYMYMYMYSYRWLYLYVIELSCVDSACREIYIVTCVRWTGEFGERSRLSTVSWVGWARHT